MWVNNLVERKELHPSDYSKNSESTPYASPIIYYTLDDGFLTVFAVLHKNMAPEKHIANRKHHSILMR